MGDMKIQNLLKALQDVQQEVDPRKAELEKVLKEELDALLEIEDLKWRQRVKENWLRYGDRNTKCVHACASHRSCRILGRLLIWMGSIVLPRGILKGLSSTISKCYLQLGMIGMLIIVLELLIKKSLPK